MGTWIPRDEIGTVAERTSQERSGITGVDQHEYVVPRIDDFIDQRSDDAQADTLTPIGEARAYFAQRKLFSNQLLYWASFSEDN